MVEPMGDVSAPDASPTVRPARTEDSGAIAAIFGLAFDDYQRALGVNAEALGRLWAGSLAARLHATLVAEAADGRILGFATVARPGEPEIKGSPGMGRQRMRAWREEIGWRGFWRPFALFLPMGLAMFRRQARKDELYISLLAVDPAAQGQGVGQRLLRAVDDDARTCHAVAVLLHTASSNARARRAYERAGYQLVASVRAPWRGPANIPGYVALRKPIPQTTP